MVPSAESKSAGRNDVPVLYVENFAYRRAVSERDRRKFGNGRTVAGKGYDALRIHEIRAHAHRVDNARGRGSGIGGQRERQSVFLAGSRSGGGEHDVAAVGKLHLLADALGSHRDPFAVDVFDFPAYENPAVVGAEAQNGLRALRIICFQIFDITERAAAVGRKFHAEIDRVLDHHGSDIEVLGNVGIIGIPSRELVSVQLHVAFVGSRNVGGLRTVKHRFFARGGTVRIIENDRKGLFREYGGDVHGAAYREIASRSLRITVAPPEEFIALRGHGVDRRGVAARHYRLDRVALDPAAVRRRIRYRQRGGNDLVCNGLLEPAVIQHDVV